MCVQVNRLLVVRRLPLYEKHLLQQLLTFTRCRAEYSVQTYSIRPDRAEQLGFDTEGPGGLGKNVPYMYVRWPIFGRIRPWKFARGGVPVSLGPEIREKQAEMRTTCKRGEGNLILARVFVGRRRLPMVVPANGTNVVKDIMSRTGSRVKGQGGVPPTSM